MADLNLKHLTKHFGTTVVAVNDLNLKVHDQEFLVLLGPPAAEKRPPCV